MCYCPTPTLYLNLALTGDCAFQLSPKKPHSVWFISVLKSGDMGQCPEKSPSPCNTCVIPVSLYKSMSWFVTKTRTLIHTYTHTYIHTHIHTHTHAYIHTHIHACNTYTHTYMYTYIHIHTHTHTHIYFLSDYIIFKTWHFFNYLTSLNSVCDYNFIYIYMIYYL